MLITALVAFMVAFFTQSADPTSVVVPVAMWIGLVAFVLAAVGIIYTLFGEKTTPVLRHSHGHA